MFASDIPIHSGLGWANIQLGSAADDVRKALATNGHPYELSTDEYAIDIHSPEATFYFDDSNPRKLTQIVFYDKNHRISDQQVIGLTLAEALLAVNVRSYEDTLWSMVSIEEEFPKGIPLPGTQRIRQASAKTKLESGTLWIKNQGIGLVMLFGLVHAIAIRKKGEEPSVGCGPLDAQVMQLSLAHEPTRKSESAREIAPGPRPFIQSLLFPKTKLSTTHSSSNNASPRRKSNYRRSAILTIIAVSFLALPVSIIYRDLTAWNKSIDVVGRVIDTNPKGPFPDEIIVEYIVDDSVKHHVTIPSTYTTAHEIDQEVELLYLPNQPQFAMTRIQIRDEGWTISPYLLFGSVGVATFFLHLAFPNHIRLNSRRTSN